jgi:hypothetical protein
MSTEAAQAPTKPPKAKVNRLTCSRCHLTAVPPIVIKAANLTRCTNAGACARRQRRLATVPEAAKP